MANRNLRKEYFKWLRRFVSPNDISYDKLLTALHKTEFTWTISMDENRAVDGMGLRRRFCYENHISYDKAASRLDGPCSILEMMVALADRCEERIMSDPDIGDRTADWFWGMIKSLGLEEMSDDNFDSGRFKEIVRIFLERCYAPDGKGGLFHVQIPRYDMRTVEIWVQAMWRLDECEKPAPYLKGDSI